MFCIASLILAIFTSSGYSKNATGDEWIKAEVYFMGWGYEARRPYRIPEIRNKYRMKIEFRDLRAERFVEWLGLNNMKSPPTPKTMVSPYMIIDLESRSGKKAIYYADFEEIVSSDFKHTKKIDRKFRDRFDFAVGENLIW
jgi:hypothetical protein